MPRKPTDLTGRRFGKLTVIETTETRNPQGRLKYKCLCDCGNEHLVAYGDLTGGKVKSCGCMTGDRRKNIIGKRFGRLVVISSTGKPHGDKNKTISHECLCDCGNTTYVSLADLMSGNVKSCGCMRKETLANNFTEHVNVPKLLKNKQRITNKSGVTGVWFNASRGRWEAEIGFGGKRYKLGRFGSLEDATVARTDAEEKLHGDFLQWYAFKKNQKSKKMQDVSGQKFGKLTAIYPTLKRSGSSVVWHCKCECGNYRDIPVSSLKTGGIKQCEECSRSMKSETMKRLYEDGTLKTLQKGYGPSPHRKDLTGRKFGKLTALNPTGEIRYGTTVVWHCVCECGNFRDEISRDLVNGRVIQCKECYKKYRKPHKKSD